MKCPMLKQTKSTQCQGTENRFPENFAVAEFQDCIGEECGWYVEYNSHHVTFRSCAAPLVAQFLFEGRKE